LDSNRVYNLLGTVSPSVGNVFTFGSQVDFEFAGTLANTFYVKTRGINSQTAGLFSNVATTSYTPVQVPDALNDNTEVLNGSGTNILSTLGVSALLALLNGLFQGNTTTGSSWGNALASSQAGVSSIVAGSNISISNSTGVVTISSTGTGGSSLWQGAARYVSSTEPTGSFNNGDVWFKV